MSAGVESFCRLPERLFFTTGIRSLFIGIRFTGFDVCTPVDPLGRVTLRRIIRVQAASRNRRKLRSDKPAILITSTDQRHLVARIDP